MYRIVFLCIFVSRSFGAPQISIETIADVKPTTLDLPLSIYNVPALQPSIEPAVIEQIINEANQDTSLDDFPFEITTENNVDSARYADIATENYDSITDIPLESSSSTDQSPRFYSNLGNFLKPQLLEDSFSDIKTTSLTYKPEEKNEDFKENVNRNTEVRTTKVMLENGTYTGDLTLILERFKSIMNKPKQYNIKPTSVYRNRTTASDAIDVSKPKNRTNDDDIKNNTDVDEKSNEIDADVLEKENEIKPVKNEIKPNRSGFIPVQTGYKPSYSGIRRKSTTKKSIQRPARRKFRSKCRCEKISNCPKLQISVARCPNDYFMCCF